MTSSSRKVVLTEAPEVKDPATVNAEEHSNVALPLTGTLPEWLRGSLFRQAPGTFDIKTKAGGVFTFDHWFDGLAMVHRFELSKGTVTYSSRHQSPAVQAAIERKGGIGPGITFGTDPQLSCLGRLSAALGNGFVDEQGKPCGNVGVDFKNIGGQLLSTSDQTLLQEFDPQTMEPGRYLTYEDLLPGVGVQGTASCTHGQRDETTHEYFNFVLNQKGPPTYTIFCVPDKPAAGAPPGHVLAQFVAPPAYIHSFGLTEHYFILLIWPLHYPLAPKILYQRNLMGTVTWRPERGVQIYVIDRQARRLVAQYRAPPHFAFHTVNAFEGVEESGARDVFVDLQAFDDAEVLTRSLTVAAMRANKEFPRTTYRRITLPRVPVAGEAISSKGAKFREALVEEPCSVLSKTFNNVDFGCVHPAQHMRKHQYVFGVGSMETKVFFSDTLFKVDILTGELVVWREEGCTPGEPVFVAAPGSEKEDAGVVLSIVSRAGNCFLLTLDAASWKEIARAPTPAPFGLGFHGQFRAASA